MFDLTVVGHFVIDIIVLRDGERVCLGGPPTYTSISARRMNLKVAVVSKVGADFPDEYVVWLAKGGVDLGWVRRVKDAPTTSFILDYRGKGRKLRLRGRCKPILPADIPETSFKGVHVAPVAGEVSEETLRKLSSLSQVVSLDLQGFVRGFRRDGTVVLRRMGRMEILSEAQILKSSSEELRAAMAVEDVWKAMEKASRPGPSIAIATEGEHGLKMLFNGVRYEVPVYRVRKPVDPTGAGDVFAGAFLAEYLRGEEPPWCASVGASAASYIVESVGPSGFASRREVLERAEEIYSRVRRFTT